jgi:transcription antitermination protein NusB
VPVGRERRAGRAKARELAMRVLYESELTGDDPGAVLELAFGRFRFSEEGRSHAEALIAAYRRHRRRIDRILQETLNRWDLARLGAIERALLRAAAAEILYLPETPAPVALNEAVRLAHRYLDERAAGFVNGVLDPIARRERAAEMTSGADGA